MKVTTADGVVTDLGTVEEKPTIGIIDYSKRTTDDFGVTTVVPRGFARTMSVKFALPYETADAVEQSLAGLRATPALWVADDRYTSLAVQGFYKDFSIDLAVAPLSYCTLTVEGLAEPDSFVDPGGDPAPDGQASTLVLLQPATIDDTALVSSSIAENDAAGWTSATTYATGAHVVVAHRIYESLEDANTGNDPAASVGAWLDTGPTNRWAMFDQALGTVSTGDPITVTLNVGAVDAVALLDVQGTSVRVQTAGYDRTQPVGSGAMTFLDLPGATANVTVTIAGGSVGTLLIGRLVELGLTEASPTAAITDYSRKAVDDFGAVTVVQRAWSKRMTANALIRSDAVDTVFGRIAAVRARPSLWIGQAGIDSLTIYGFFKTFSIEIADQVSRLSLSIEGLSKAAKPAPLTAAVDWPSVGDPDGTKPANNATNSADPKSAFGPRSTVADALQQIADGAAAVAAAHDDIAAAQKAVTDLSAEADGLASQAQGSIVAALQSEMLAEADRLRTEASALLGGQKVGLVLRQEVVNRVEGDATIQEQINLLGVVTADGSAFVINLDKVMVSPTQSFSGRLTQLTAELNTAIDTKASVTQLGQAVADANSANAQALQQVVAELNGAIDAKASTTQLQQASVNQSQALAAAIQQVNASFGDQLATKASTLYVDQSVATEAEARSSALSQVSARLRQGSPNLLDNPDFTDGLDYWISDAGGEWDVVTDAGVGIFVQCSGPTAAVLYQDTPVHPGSDYSLSVEADPDDPATGQALFDWLDKSGYTIARTVMFADSWVRAATQPVTAPAAAVAARIYLRVGAAGQMMRATRVQFQQGPATDFRPSLGTKASIVRLDRAVSDAEQASASALSEVKAELKGDIDSKAGVTDLQQAVTTEQEARASALQTVQSELQGEIDSKAAVTDLQTAISTEQQARAQDISTVEANLGTASGRIDALKQVLVDASGNVATKAVFALDANGKVVGYTATNDGHVGSIVFEFDSFTLLRPDGSPIFVADDNGFYAPNLTVNTLALNTAIVPAYVSLSSPVTGNGGPSSSAGGGSAPGGGVGGGKSGGVQQ